MNLPSRPRLLLAEDDQDLADACSELLESFGFEVTTVADGHAAVEAARHCSPVIVILDVGTGTERVRGLPMLRETSEASTHDCTRFLEGSVREVPVQVSKSTGVKPKW